jgi:positive regulator of sigma E activity
MRRNNLRRSFVLSSEEITECNESQNNANSVLGACFLLIIVPLILTVALILANEVYSGTLFAKVFAGIFAIFVFVLLFIFLVQTLAARRSAENIDL